MSLATPPDGNDFGIVFDGVTATPGTYIDIWGQTRTQADLRTSAEVFMANDIGTAYFHAGIPGRVTFQVDVVLSDATVDIALNGHNDLDPTQPFGKLATFRNDTQTNLAIHTFTASGRYFLQTADLGTVPEGAISVTPSLGGEGSASVVVMMRVER